jgi:hypothetical protein
MIPRALKVTICGADLFFQQFNIVKITLEIYNFDPLKSCGNYMVLTVNSDYFLKQH